jgi:DNA-binding XRE family transcriptional regulator
MHQRELDPGASVPAYFGAQLRRYRKAAGLTQEELGERINYTGALVGMIETTLRSPTLQFAEMCDRVLDTNGLFAGLWPLVGLYLARDPDLGVLEASAVSIRSMSQNLVPDLLRTAEYARAVLLGMVGAVPEDLDQSVAALMDRQGILRREARPLLWCVVGEVALRCLVGGREVMRDQLKALLAASESRSAVVQVVALDAGAHPGLDCDLTLLSFADGPDVGFISGHGTRVLIEAPDRVVACQYRYDLTRAAALSPGQSADVIRRVMDEL